jgi:hypothetical protein
MKTKMNLWGIGVCAAAIVLFLLACPASAQMKSDTVFTLDFTKPAELSKKANWGTESKNVTVSQGGLTLQTPENTSSDVWVQVTEPIAVGFSWRTVSSVNIEAEVAPPGRFVFQGNSIAYPEGSLYARYSADALHWSNWQYIQKKPLDPNKPQQKYSGTLSIPARQRQKYNELLAKYQKMDVPWVNDEEAAVEWIVKNDPKFFESSAPFIGYVQFLFEISLKGGQNIKTINFDIYYAAGGLNVGPKDPNGYKGRDVPWRYKAPSISKTENIKHADALQSAIDAYYLNCGVYPKNLDELLVCPAGFEDRWAGPYIKESQLYDSQGKRYIYMPGKLINEDSDTK